MSRNLIIQSPLHGHFREVKNKRKFQTFSSKTRRGRLQEVPNLAITLVFGSFWYFGKLVDEGKWSLTRGGLFILVT